MKSHILFQNLIVTKTIQKLNSTNYFPYKKLVFNRLKDPFKVNTKSVITELITNLKISYSESSIKKRCRSGTSKRQKTKPLHIEARMIILRRLGGRSLAIHDVIQELYVAYSGAWEINSMIPPGSWHTNRLTCNARRRPTERARISRQSLENKSS